MKTTSKERIRLALDRSGKTITDLAKHLKKSQPTISERLKGDDDTDSVSLIEAAAVITGHSFAWLMTGQGPEKSDGTELKEQFPHYTEPKTTEKLEKLVASQERTIQLLEKEIERLEAQLKEKQKVKK